MIQDIYPYIFDNSFKEQQPDDDSFAVIIGEGTVLVRENLGEIELPRMKALKKTFSEAIYLFHIGEDRYFYIPDSSCIDAEAGEYDFVHMGMLYRKKPIDKAFAAVTAYQICSWYRGNRYCGRCGGKMERDHKERMMKCTSCNISLYPKICPVAIVGIRNNDQILLTKYAGRNMPFYALIAGFSEVGETIEGTVRREVMEEVGLKVKNITYFASQPWSMSESLLFGFFCDVDGESNVTLDENELSTAVWVDRKDVPKNQDSISLTSYMMTAFAEGRDR